MYVHTVVCLFNLVINLYLVIDIHMFLDLHLSLLIPSVSVHVYTHISRERESEIGCDDLMI